MTRQDKLILGLTMLVMIAVAVWQVLRGGSAESHNPFLPEMSSISALPTGSKAVYLVLEDLGHKPVRWGRSFAQVRDKKGTVVTFGVEPMMSPMGMPSQIDRGEIASIKEWVKKGNTLLAFGNAATTIFDDLATKEFEGAQGKGKGKLNGLTFIGCMSVFLRAGKDDRVLINTTDGAFGLERKLSDGTAYLFADEYILSNVLLGEAHNAAILTLIPKNGGQVFIDDFHRGHVAGGSALELLPPAVRTAVLLCLLVGAIAVARHSSRFGPVTPSEEREVRSGAEIAWSLSRLLRQADAAPTAARELVRAFKADIGLPQEEPLEAALDRLSEENTELRGKARELQPALESGKMDKVQLMQLTKLLADVRKLIRDEARGRYTNR